MSKVSAAIRPHHGWPTRGRVAVSTGSMEREGHYAAAGNPGVEDSRVPSVRFTLRQLEYFLARGGRGQRHRGGAGHPGRSVLGVRGDRAARGRAGGAAPHPPPRSGHLAHGGGPAVPRAGAALLRHADELERFASELTGELSGTLHLGCLVTVAPLMMPRLGKGFRERHPAVALEMVEAGQQELVSACAQVAWASPHLRPGARRRSGVRRAGPAAALAVFAADHPLAGAESVTVAQLAAEPLVLLDLPHSRDYFRALFWPPGWRPRWARSVHPDVIRTMVANGFGYSIFNARAGTAVALDGMPLANVRSPASPADDPRARAAGQRAADATRRRLRAALPRRDRLRRGAGRGAAGGLIAPARGSRRRGAGGPVCEVAPLSWMWSARYLASCQTPQMKLEPRRDCHGSPRK